MARFPIVGIGSSAGGLEALQALFRAMPPDGGLGFVVAAHLDPTRESYLGEVLGRCTTMPVVQIEDSTPIEPDRVHVIAPDQELTIQHGILHAHKPLAPRGQRHPIDAFLRSLAEDQGECAIAVILSGTGSDGSLGLRFVKAEGGIVIVQEPDTAAFQGMPHSAIGTGIVDLILPPQEIPQALLGLARHPYVRQPAKRADVALPDAQLKAVLALVRGQTKRDFSGYRKRMLLRRIHRRAGLHRIESMPDYIERLQGDPAEVRALAADLAISVTSFFRDPEAWAALAQEVIAPLVRDRPAAAPVRVWVPGCSTGEEAYSIAMLIAEQAEAVGKAFELKLFATDMAEGLLAWARAGIYPASIAQDVTPERLARFFERVDDSYCVSKRIRETVTFALQDVLQDPPFSRLDLISCRNLLIYLEPEFQRRVLGVFHFALRENGHLFLGSAETIASQEGLFQPIAMKRRIYRRVGPKRHDAVELPLPGGSSLTADPGERAPVTHALPQMGPGKQMERALLDRYAPPSALIDARSWIHYLHGPTEEYLRPPAGEPSNNLLAMAREGLQTPLRMAVRHALDHDQEVSAQAQVRRGPTLHPVRLVVTPLGAGPHPGRKLLVSFFEQDTVTGAPAPAPMPDDRRLQTELDQTREDLRLTVEQMEAANEELQASNEEIRSMNEELQAANEELETSKEELQSLNEELNAVNSQLEAKVSELEARTGDLNNLLNSTEIATLFLDRDLRIRWFTPTMKALLELRPSDIGRPVSHFAQRFSGGDLLEGAHEALAKLSTADTEVVSDQGRWYIRHMRPYRTADDRIDGVVVTFTEITERKRAEAALKAAHERVSDILESVTDAFYAVDKDWRLTFVNRCAEELWGRPREELLGRRLWDLFGDQDTEARESYRVHMQAAREQRPVRHEFKSTVFGSWVSASIYPQSDGGLAVYLRDISERKHAEEERELLTRELSHRVKNIFAVVQALARQTDGRGGSIEAFRDTFLGRLQALARAHSVLLEAHWRSADLKALVEQAVEAYRVDHPEIIEIVGDPVVITPRQGLGLSLVLHELGTNAAKYGALSRAEGRVRVSWRVEAEEDGRRVRLTWWERHGPALEAPREKGFGTRLIERACAYELDGEVELDFAPDGLMCKVVFPLA